MFYITRTIQLQLLQFETKACSYWSFCCDGHNFRKFRETKRVRLVCLIKASEGLQNYLCIFQNVSK